MDFEQTETMKKVFAIFDQGKTGYVDTIRFSDILRQLGCNFDEDDLQGKINDVDKDGSGRVNFDSFCTIVMPFLEDDDDEAMNEELKEAFRLYDKKGEGFITRQVLKEILKELDPKLTKDDLDSIIEEVDEDGSGTVDFDEFMEMMKG